MSQAASLEPDHNKLLEIATTLAQSGNATGAYALLLALTRAYPYDAQTWFQLAAVAPSAAERRAALIRVLELDPTHAPALQALRDFDNEACTVTDPVAPGLTVPDTVATDGADDAEEPPRPAWVPPGNLIAIGITALLLALIGIVIGQALVQGPSQAENPSPPPTLTDESRVAAGPLTPPADSASASTESAAVADWSQPPTLAPTHEAVRTASPTPVTLPLGTVVDYDGWSFTLLRPDHALTLDGTLGDLRPSGRFVLTVVALSNNRPEPRRVPPTFFVLQDDAGRTYQPVPGASTLYLALYERARYGDLALEDPFDPKSGMRSVPILFDVPSDARGLRLIAPGAGGAGWPVGESTIPASSGP